MAELQDYIDKGMRMADIVAHYRKHHPDRIRTVTRVSVGEAGIHTAASIKQMRPRLGGQRRQSPGARGDEVHLSELQKQPPI